MSKKKILVPVVKSVSSKNELETLSYKKTFLIRSEILVLNIELEKVIFS